MRAKLVDSLLGCHLRDVHVAVRVEPKAVRGAGEVAGAFAPASPASGDLTLRRYDAHRRDLLMPALGDVKEPVAVDNHVVGTAQPLDLRDVPALLVEHLASPVLTVQHVYPVIVSDGYVVRQVQPARALARLAEGQHQLPVARELVDAVLAVAVGHEQIARPGERRASRPVEGSARLPGLPLRAQREPKLAGRCVLADRMVVRVRQKHLIAGPYPYAMRGGEQVLAPRVQHLSVPVEHEDGAPGPACIAHREIDPVPGVCSHVGHDAFGRVPAPTRHDLVPVVAETEPVRHTANLRILDSVGRAITSD